MSNTLLSSAYLAPIEYYSKLVRNNCTIEHHENYIKQTYRNRCEIYSPNGILNLTVPLIKRNKRQIMNEIRISYEYDWQKLHWRSIESCYRGSAFFEYFEDDLKPFYENKNIVFLIDLNEQMQRKILELLQLKINYTFTQSYEKVIEGMADFRNTIKPKENNSSSINFPINHYFQVFENKHGFIPNLSIVDLLFNQGPRAKDFLR